MNNNIFFFGSRKRNSGTQNQEFAIWQVQYTEGIYKTFVRLKQRECYLRRKSRDISYIGGLQYREFTVDQ